MWAYSLSGPIQIFYDIVACDTLNISININNANSLTRV